MVCGNNSFACGYPVFLFPALFVEETNLFLLSGLGMLIENQFIALTGVAQWIERWPANHRVAGSIPNWGTCLGCGPGPQ